MPLSNSGILSPTRLSRCFGQFLAQQHAALVGGREPVAARQDVQRPHDRRIGNPALHDHGIDAQFLQGSEIDQAGVDLFDARNLGDFVAQLVAQDAGQSLLGPALLDDDGQLSMLVNGLERLLGTAGDAHQRHDRPDGHGHADDGQRGSHAAADDVLKTKE